MLAIQVMISLCVLSLGVMMPAVANDLAIDPKLVGIFTAIIYAVAAVRGARRGGPIVRLGAVRVCQAALLMAAIGLAFNSLALVAATVVAVMFIGAAQGPINPASAHVLSQRVPREYFGMVFSLKQTGVPIGFALAGIIFPPCSPGSAGAAPAWSPPAPSCCRRSSIEPLRPRIDVVAVAGSPPRASGARSASCWAMPSCACSAGRPSSMSSPSTPSPSIWSPISMSIAASASPAPAPAVALAARRHGHAAGERRRRRPLPAHGGCWAGPASA